MNNFEKAYKELVNSDEYKEKAQEVLDIVEKNKESYKERLAERLKDIPVATLKDKEEFMGDIEGLTKELDDAKRAKSSLERKVNKIKSDSEKEIKALKEEVAKLKEENSKAQADEALKKELDSLKKEFAALKAQVNTKAK